MKQLALFLLLLIPFKIIAFTEDENKKAMYREFDFIHSIFEAHYAPAEWKKTYCGWDLEDEIASAKANIAAITPITLKDFQREILRFVHSTKDYHVSASFYSTEKASLPFYVSSIDKRYFITYVKEEISSALSIGDELIDFNGHPVQDTIDALRFNSFRQATDETDQFYLENQLTYRSANDDYTVPQGPISITVRSKDTGIQQEHTLVWDYVPERICSFQESDYQQEHNFRRKEMSLPHPNSQIHELSNKYSFVPKLGDQIDLITHSETSELPFHAYLFKFDDYDIGYIRIPTYSVDAPCYHEEAFELERNAEFFNDIICLFEQETDALIVDQVNNGGGNLYYTYALLSSLADKPLKILPHQLLLTQKDVHNALRELNSGVTDEESINGYPITSGYDQSKTAYNQFIISEWEAKNYLTSPVHFDGIDLIQPNPKGHYTKPILFLINSLDFSGADFVPAILQDNKRALLFGERTAGAGGIVETFSYPNRFGIKKLGLTNSIAWREEEQPIENLGVEPDVKYKLTVDDLQNNYRGYKEKLLETLRTMLRP